MTAPLEDELIAREAQWRASLLDITDYYESVMLRRGAELVQLREQFAEMQAECVAMRETLDRYDRRFSTLRGSLIWRLARAIKRPRD